MIPERWEPAKASRAVLARRAGNDASVRARLRPDRMLRYSVVVPDTTTVTRRFCARPSAVSLVAMGRDSP